MRNIGISKTQTVALGGVVTFVTIIMQATDNIYITSPNFGSFDTICQFSNNVNKQVPVVNDYGYINVDQLMATNDYLNCSGLTISQLEFHLRDGEGEYVNMRGNDISFSVV